MKLLNEHHSFTGMQRDIDISKHQVSFLYNARNIRLSCREEGTLTTLTNEKGTKETNISVTGEYLGHCVVNNYIVVFSKDTNDIDYISCIDLDKETVEVLYEGNLNFSLEHPIEAICSYENDNIQKVYWTDGHNQPRVINIKGNIIKGLDTQFDFIRELQLKEVVTVHKELGASGLFAPGVIQYAFTYYTKHGQESNIFYTSPLIYISYKDRGGSPEDRVENAFRINVKHLDNNFDYLRIYSIQRTSINNTPIVKRIQDIDIKGLEEASFLDTGTTGDSIDPTELLYKGGESIKAGTLEQKDNTLFLGNITLERKAINKDLQDLIRKNSSIFSDTRYFFPTKISDDGYVYHNQLTSYDDRENSVPCGGFKHGDYYRCGVQFQHKSGKWSEPVFIEDTIQEKYPSYDSIKEYVNVPIFICNINNSKINKDLLDAGYVKARAVVVYPEIQDRVTICQGVSCPTVYTTKQRNADKSLYAQSSWFFRPSVNNPTVDKYINDNGTVTPKDVNYLAYTNKGLNYNPEDILQVEIQGDYNDESKFQIDTTFCTLHSPDIEFDDSISLLEFNNVMFRYVGKVEFTNTLSDIEIQTSTSTISNGGSGFLHKSFSEDSSHGIVSGLFYEDYLVDESKDGTKFSKWRGETEPYKFLVYPWHKNGSLNNDIERPVSTGTRSAELKKKVISNLRFTNTRYSIDYNEFYDSNPVVFSNDQLAIVKVNDKIYQGNIDTLIVPDNGEGVYFNIDESIPDLKGWAKTFSLNEDSQDKYGIYHYNLLNSGWGLWENKEMGDNYINLVINKDPVRMRYKSTPHLVFESQATYSNDNPNYSSLGILEVVRQGDDEDSYYRKTMFGGTDKDGLQSNTWIPCGEPVDIPNTGTIAFQYSYGDTYFQRWDCLKTYPFSQEDINQVVEIGSFMLETRINIDGRYDRNRGQINNINVTPVNFNLLNPVYSQVNNFFSYKILDDDYYELNKFSNQITWTKEKQAGADVDLWTNITLASVYDLDGSKGSVNSINTYKDNIYCFQDKGISMILFNSRVQVATSDGVPIELSNSYKVNGHRYISENIGCSNKSLIKSVSSGIYFIDSITKDLHHLGESISNVAITHSMSSWFKNNDVNRLLYDDINHDLYVTKESELLGFSEILGQFISFYDYEFTSLIETYKGKVFIMRNNELYKMFEGEYNTLYGNIKSEENNKKINPWEFTFISNGVDSSAQDMDKIFSNIDYRMDLYDNNGIIHNASLSTIRVTNEYQDTGEVILRSVPVLNNAQTLQKKFRIWRIQIPRNKNSLDRIRNTWCKITLKSKDNNYKALLHDLNVQYYIQA